MLSTLKFPNEESDNSLILPSVQPASYQIVQQEVVHKRHSEEDKENRKPSVKRSRIESSSDDDSGDVMSDSESDTDSEEEVFFSDDEPDEEVLGVVAELKKRWAAQRQLAEESKSSANEQVPRPKTPVVFRFDEHFPDFTLWPGSVPPKERMDMSHYIREPELVAQGQPERIIDFPDVMAYVRANEGRTTPHPRADMFHPGFSRGQVAYQVDPYFYVDVGVPPPDDKNCTPTVSDAFRKVCPGIPESFLNPGPNDPIIPIFYKKPEIWNMVKLPEK